MDYLPVFMALRGRNCLVVGGSGVAARKASLLLGAGAYVSVVATELSDAFRELPAERLTQRARPFEPSDLDGVVFAIAAHETRAVNQAVSAAAQARSVPVNVVDDPELCSVILPAIVDRTPVLIAIGTGGASPVLARLWRARIEALVPEGVRHLAELAAAMRGEVQLQLTDANARRRFWEDALEGEVAALALAGERKRAEHALRELLAACTCKASAAARRGWVSLVGAGPNDPELLTLRALRALQHADCVLAEPRVAQAVLELGRRDAERERLLGWPVPDVNALAQRLVTEVSSGRTVCIVAYGDAFREPAGLALSARLDALGVARVVVAGIA